MNQTPSLVAAAGSGDIAANEIRIHVNPINDHDRTADWLRRVLAEARAYCAAKEQRAA